MRHIIYPARNPLAVHLRHRAPPPAPAHRPARLRARRQRNLASLPSRRLRHSPYRPLHRPLRPHLLVPPLALPIPHRLAPPPPRPPPYPPLHPPLPPPLPVPRLALQVRHRLAPRHRRTRRRLGSPARLHRRRGFGRRR